MILLTKYDVILGMKDLLARTAPCDGCPIGHYLVPRYDNRFFCVAPKWNE